MSRIAAIVLTLLCAACTPQQDVDDGQAGDAIGHGKDGKWFAIAPDGAKAGR